MVTEKCPRQTPPNWRLNTQRILSTGFIHHLPRPPTAFQH
jgi:hypothetical protein